MSIRLRSPLHSAGLFAFSIWGRLSEPLEWPWPFPTPPLPALLRQPHRSPGRLLERPPRRLTAIRHQTAPRFICSTR